LREVERDAHVSQVMVDHTKEPKAPARRGQAETPKLRTPKLGISKPGLPKSQIPELDSPETDASSGERVAKALARAGVASRREIERYIAEGRVALNGRVLDTPAVKIGPGDVLSVDGAPVAAAEATRVWRYHKPVGLVTSHKDPHDRPTVFDALPSVLPRVISVGRLDLNSEGLLLLTNDGGLARALELPSSGWVRRYRARAYGRTSQEALDRLQNGITVEGVVYGAIEAKLDKVQRRPGETTESSANCWITVSLKEGKNREVRRVLEALGLKVNRLVRLSYGPFALGTLPLGAVEEVGPRVIREQLADYIAPENLPTGERSVHAPIPAPGRRPTTPAAAVGAEGGTGRPEKKVYKPGWAKPSKPKNPHHHPPKRKPVEAAAAPTRAAPPRAPSPRPPSSPPGSTRPASGRPPVRRGPPKPRTPRS
jgi:23S rRNA pseudouridine2605 synthase